MCPVSKTLSRNYLRVASCYPLSRSPHSSFLPPFESLPRRFFLPFLFFSFFLFSPFVIRFLLTTNLAVLTQLRKESRARGTWTKNSSVKEITAVQIAFWYNPISRSIAETRRGLKVSLIRGDDVTQWPIFFLELRAFLGIAFPWNCITRPFDEARTKMAND